MANIIEITNFMDPELDVYARLTEAQLLNRFEPKKGMFIAESPKVIDRALDAGCIPVSCLMGSLLLLLADTVSRSVGGGSALPVGAITSLLGAPFFLFIIFSRKERG